MSESDCEKLRSLVRDHVKAYGLGDDHDIFISLNALADFEILLTKKDIESLTKEKRSA